MTNKELLEIIEKAARDKATTLDLSDTGLTTLPAEIGQLTNLTGLSLSHNQLTTLPAEIGQLINLSLLYLDSNQLTTLPAEIGQLTNLTGLSLSHNQLTTLPAEIGQLTKLSELLLSYNQLTTLPAEIGQLTNLSELYLDCNQLTTLPAEIGQLTNLTGLSLSHNQLTTLPAEIGQLTKLSELLLSYNQLTTLPPVIGQLTNLSELNLRSNQLTTLPPVIGQLTNLKIFALQNNQLVNLPQEIQRLSSLKKLDLRGNQLQIPPEILGDAWDNLGAPSKILSYYFSLQVEPKKPLNEAKVLVVGQGSVGKTSLVKRLIENSYDPHERKTEGINIQNWQMAVNDQSIRLNVWDFGGQEIMHATHQFFLTKRSLYLLVLDARVDERQNELEYWLKIIQSFGGDSGIILVGNKIDQHPLDIDQNGLRQKYPTIKDIVPVSCQTGQGLEQLQLTITRELAGLDHIHDLLPQSWFQVKTRLEQMKQDYIPYSDYERLCQKEQVTNTRNQSTLIELLHQLGIVLNFRDDPRLEDTHVLNPEWVTNGVYKILNDNRLMTEFRGILEREQLNRILDCPQYPRSKQQFIVEMVRKFELCFPLEDGTGDRFLIPDLLPKEEPATGEWNHVLAFEYHYNVLPSSIISRFIVRMHHYGDRKTWWRSGIVLKHRTNRALVKSDREDGKIFISISGPQSTRRELLAMIRSQFDAIHPKGIVAQEKVPLSDYPAIPPIDYEHLLNLEEMNETSFIPPGLKERVSVRQLLDGIEAEEQRRERQREREDKFMGASKSTRLSNPEFEKEIFISYTWRDEHSKPYVEQLEQTFQAKDIKIIRDTNAVDYKARFKEFMQRIARGKWVIAVISEQYLKSENCMFELVEITKNGEFYRRIFPIILSDAKISKPIQRIKYVTYWEEQIKELDEAMKGVNSANLQGFREDIDLYTDIRNTIAELTNLLRDMNTLTPEIHSQSEFEELLKAIEKHLDE
jgi:internalin A